MKPRAPYVDEATEKRRATYRRYDAKWRASSSENRAKRTARAMEANAVKRDRIYRWKLFVGCTDCGYREHSAALDFDHVRDGKTSNIAKMAGCASMERLMAEMAKCEVVCANCHRVRTVERQNAKP